MSGVSKTGKKAANAAEKARKAVTLDAAARKRAACRRKLLAKNDRKAKSRVAREAKANLVTEAAC